MPETQTYVLEGKRYKVPKGTSLEELQQLISAEEKPTEPSTPADAGWLSTAVGDIKGALTGPISEMLKQTPPGKLMEAWKEFRQPGVHAEEAKAQAAQSAKERQFRKEQGYPSWYRALAEVAPAVGVNPAAMEEAASRGATGEVIGHTIVPTALALSPLAAEGATGMVSRLRSPISVELMNEYKVPGLPIKLKRRGLAGAAAAEETESLSAPISRTGSAGDLAQWTADDLWSGYMQNRDSPLGKDIAAELRRRGLAKVSPAGVRSKVENVPEKSANAPASRAREAKTVGAKEEKIAQGASTQSVPEWMTQQRDYEINRAKAILRNSAATQEERLHAQRVIESMREAQ